MYEMTDLQYQAVYNVLSFALASMMATTMYLWFRHTAVDEKYRSAVLISGLVTFIAAYHYIRIFNSWVDSYEYSAGKVSGGAMDLGNPSLTGVPFNDAYRYMDWLLTVPLLLIEILMVMNLEERDYNEKSKSLGVSAALMIVSGYYGELATSPHVGCAGSFPCSSSCTSCMSSSLACLKPQTVSETQSFRPRSRPHR